MRENSEPEITHHDTSHKLYEEGVFKVGGQREVEVDEESVEVLDQEVEEDVKDDIGKDLRWIM